MAGVVPNGEGKYAAQVLNVGVAARLVEVDHGLLVRVGVELVAQDHQGIAKLSVILGLAAKHDADSAVLVGRGLAARFQVDDGQTPVGQAHGAGAAPRSNPSRPGRDGRSPGYGAQQLRLAAVIEDIAGDDAHQVSTESR